MASQSSVDDGDAAVPKLTAVSSSEEEEEEDEDVEEEYVEETQPLLDAASRGPRRRHRGGTKLPQPQHQDSFLRQTQQPEQGQQGSDDATGSGSEHPGLMQLYSVGIEELERRTLLLQAVYMLFGAAILYLVARDGLPVDVMVFTLVFFYHFLVLIVGFVSTNLLLLDVWFYSMCVSVGMIAPDAVFVNLLRSLVFPGGPTGVPGATLSPRLGGVPLYMGGMWAMVAIPTTVVAVHAFIRTQRRASALVVAFVLASAAILVAEVTVTRVPVWQPTSTVNVTVFGIPAYLILAELLWGPCVVLGFLWSQGSMIRCVVATVLIVATYICTSFLPWVLLEYTPGSLPLLGL